jgi:hypothetical protein
MKFLTLIFTIVLCFTGFSQFTKEEIKAVRIKIGKGVSYSYDNHKGILWVQSKQVTIEGSSYFYLYYGLKKQNDSIVRTALRVKSRLHRTGWIFANSVSFALMTYKEEDKGRVTSVSYSDKSPARDVYSGGYIQEILDNVVSYELIDLLKYAIENKRMITVRFTGDEKYTEQAIFAARLKGLTAFFDSMNTYSE